MNGKPTRGGKREGAGRKPGTGAGRTVRTSSINLPLILWAKLDSLRGDSTRSAWIAANIAAARTPLAGGEEHDSPPQSSVVDLIRRHNRWRRSDESLPMESPTAIGAALDAVCDRVETLEKWVVEGKRNDARCAEERDRIHAAVREYGRYGSEKAFKRMMALLPEHSPT